MHLQTSPDPPSTALVPVSREQPIEPVSRLPADMPLKTACRIVRHLILELLILTGDRMPMRRDRRRFACHARQIGMYVCHVRLAVPQGDVGIGFGRDRTTVGYACQIVEERREDPAFDDFVCVIERLVAVVFDNPELARHE